MAKLTRKSYQRKAMVVGATAFAGIALVATGFAAWVISSSATKNVQGNVNVGVVADKSIQLTVDPITEKFSFDAKEGDNTGRVRCDGHNFENLSITVKGNYTNATMVNKFSIALRMGTMASETAEPVFDETAEGRFNTAAGETKKYIVLPDCFGTNAVTFNTKGESIEGKRLTVTGDNATFEYKISFKWGDFFKGMNPSEYYDTGDGALIPDAKYKSDLKDFYSTLTGDTEAVEPDITNGFKKLNFVVVVTADTSGSATPAA